MKKGQKMTAFAIAFLAYVVIFIHGNKLLKEFPMQLTKIQVERLLEVDFTGKSGKEKQIAEALGHKRCDLKMVDAVDASGTYFEYKKQSSMQWFDLAKLATIHGKMLDTPILFFMHKEGALTAVYLTDYRGVRASMPFGKKAWKWARKCPATAQIKYPMKHRQIRSFECLYKV